MSKRFKNLSFNTTCRFIQHCRKPSDVTSSRDKTHKATHLTRLSHIKIRRRIHSFQKYRSLFVPLFGTKSSFLGSWPMDYSELNTDSKLGLTFFEELLGEIGKKIQQKVAVASPNGNCRDRTHGHVSASRQLHPPRLKTSQTSLLEITANSAHGEEVSQTNQTQKARFRTFLGTGHFARFTLLPMWEDRNKLLLL